MSTRLASSSGNISGVAVAMTLVGGILAYSGIKGISVSSAARSLLSGNVPTGPANANANSTATADPSTAATSAPGGTAQQNKAIARMLAVPYGWESGNQWDALDKLWTRESSWSNTAKNASSGAYGIPQALPATKLPKLGQEPTSNASAQIAWGLSYIKGRYGSPVNAWAHETAMGWY